MAALNPCRKYCQAMDMGQHWLDRKSHIPGQQDLYSLPSFPCLYSNVPEVREMHTQLGGPVIPHSHRHWKIRGCAFRRGKFHLISCRLLHCLLITPRISVLLIMIEIWPSRVWGVTPVYRIMNIRTLGFFVGPGEKLPLNSVGRYMTLSENKNKFMLFPKALERAQTSDPSLGWPIVSKNVEDYLEDQKALHWFLGPGQPCKLGQNWNENYSVIILVPAEVHV